VRVMHPLFSEVEGDFFAAFDILFGFQIADLGFVFVLGFCFFLSLRLFVHIGIGVDYC
jgi:hypothetical protein